MTLKDKVIIVTGATSGIGLAIVKQALKLEAKVMLHCAPNAKNTAQQLVDDFGENAAFVAVDLAEFNALDAITRKTINIFGKVDGLVNNAGVFPRNDISNITEDDYNHIFAVNIKAPLFLSKLVVEEFLAKNINGSIVNIGSINAYTGQSDLLIYSLSKGALMTMTRNLADALAEQNIRVNQINVGHTHTEAEHIAQLQTGQGEDWYKNISKLLAPRGTILSPQEVARHVVFWLSDYSSPVSGSVYEVEQYPIIGRNKNQCLS